MPTKVYICMLVLSRVTGPERLKNTVETTDIIIITLPTIGFK